MRRTCLAMILCLGGISPLALADEPKASQGNVTPNDATLGQKPPEGAIVLFNGEDLTGWVKDDGKTPAAWKVEDGILLVTPGQGKIQTEKTYGDFTLHIEFNVPYMPKARGQARGNSGVFLSGIYELQVLDSYGLKSKDNDCGAIYKVVAPSVNACKPPLQWQTYDVTFHKAKVEDGKVVKQARVSVIQNGIKTIDDVAVAVTPGGASNKEGDAGPLLLQDHGNEVLFRNIWLKPIE